MFLQRLFIAVPGAAGIYESVPGKHMYGCLSLDRQGKREVSAKLYSRAMKFAAMSPASFARESGRLASFNDRQYKFRFLTPQEPLQALQQVLRMRKRRLFPPAGSSRGQNW